MKYGEVALRYHDGDEAYLIEQKPHWQTLLFNPVKVEVCTEGHPIEYTRRVLMPYLYYWMRPLRVRSFETSKRLFIERLYCSPSKVKSVEDSLYMIPLPNLHYGYVPCYNWNVTPLADKDSLTMKVNNALVTWWGADFNGDYLADGQIINRWLPSCWNASCAMVHWEKIRTLAEFRALPLHKVASVNRALHIPEEALVNQILV